LYLIIVDVAVHKPGPGLGWFLPAAWAKSGWRKRSGCRSEFALCHLFPIISIASPLV